jgi:hypothetical protein
MPLIVIRLHPKKPATGSDFTQYLEGLKIEVADRSFADPDGRLPAHVLGSAKYDPTDANSTIVQHVVLGPPAGPPPAPPTVSPASIATAAIDVTMPANEYLNPDLVLTVTRTIAGDTTPLAVKDLNYNVDLDAAPLPGTNSPVAYANLEPVSLYVAVPAALTGLPAGTAFLEVPTDGTPPSYQAVLKAMKAVVAKDPGSGSPPDLAALTAAQCRHIAREIVFNRILEPLPKPPDNKSLEDLYKEPGSDKDARNQFEADLVTYNAVHSTRAEALTKYVYGVSAALACQANTQSTTQVELTIPVFPGLAPVSGAVRTVSVVVSQ